MGLFSKLFGGSDKPKKEISYEYLEGSNLTDEQMMAISIGHLLCVEHFCYVNALEAVGQDDLKSADKLMSRWWGITDRNSALETMEYLKNAGDRYVYKYVGVAFDKYIKASGKPDLRKVNGKKYTEIFNLIAEETKSDYNAEKIDIAMNCKSDKDADKKGVLKEFGILMAAKALMDNMVDDESRAIDLLTTKKSRDLNVFGKLDGLGVSLTAFDMGRLVSLARYTYALGYISAEEAWDYINWAKEETLNFYDSWETFGAEYQLGLIVKMGFSREVSEIERNYEKALDVERKGIWAQYPLKK